MRADHGSETEAAGTFESLGSSSAPLVLRRYGPQEVTYDISFAALPHHLSGAPLPRGASDYRNS